MWTVCACKSASSSWVSRLFAVQPAGEWIRWCSGDNLGPVSKEAVNNSSHWSQWQHLLCQGFSISFCLYEFYYCASACTCSATHGITVAILSICPSVTALACYIFNIHQPILIIFLWTIRSYYYVQCANIITTCLAISFSRHCTAWLKRHNFQGSCFSR